MKKTLYYKKIILLLTLFFATTSLFAIKITMPENSYVVDNKNNIIIIYLLPNDMHQDYSSSSNMALSFNNGIVYFKEKIAYFSYKKSYEVIYEEKNYTLYITELPLLTIKCNRSIPNEPKVLANFTYYDSLQSESSIMGIELRGGVSVGYPKKTYDLEFWNDELGLEEKDMQFGNLRSDDDWVLDALYNEPLRIRSFTAHNIWNELHTLYYQEKEPKAKSGAGVMLAELFLNNEYKGLYMFMEQVDRNLLKLKKHKDIIRGELFKGVTWSDAVLFKSAPSYSNNKASWSGFEYKYPKDTINWGNLYDFVSFVVNSSNTTFNTDIWNNLQEDNFIDYFIFLNTITAGDNLGKNIYYARYDTNEPYFLIPWDLDGCFGTNWKGAEEVSSNDFLCDRSELYYKIYSLKPNNFQSKLASRYQDLRYSTLAYNSMMKRFENTYNYLKDNLIYQRESIVWQNYPYNEASLEYLEEWSSQHLDFLDNLFDVTIVNITSQKKEEQDVVRYDGWNKRITIIGNNVNSQNYSIYSLNGQLVKLGKIQNNELSLHGIKTGVYLFKFKNQAIKFQIK